MIRLLVASAVVLTAAGRAPPELGTKGFDVRVEQRDGRFVGCGATFTQLLQEAAGGGFVQMAGMVALGRADNGALEWRVAIVPGDIRVEHGQVGIAAFDPAEAALSGDVFSTAGHEAERSPCDSGGFCAIYRDDTAMVGLMGLLSDPGGFTVAYRRPGADTAVTAHVVDVPKRRSADAATLSTCALSMLGEGLQPNPK